MKNKQEDRAFIYNVAITKDGYDFYRSHLFDRGFSGTGDLFASVICGSLVKGLSVQEAVKSATYFLQEAIEEAISDYDTVLAKCNKFSDMIKSEAISMLNISIV